jgi:uncharacterized iron-regulated protein/predicted esterase
MLLLCAAACAPSGGSRPPAVSDSAAPTPPDRQPGPLDRRIRIFDREGREIDLAAMLDRLATQDAVFLGETHLDDTTHRVELAVLEGLADRRKDEIVLSLEMFERDVQPALNAYLAGERDEASFLAEARPWGNYPTDYRPLVESARVRKLEVVAANLPRPMMSRVSELPGLGEGASAAFDAMRAEHPDWLPETVHPPDEAYWARVGRVLRGHGPSPGGGGDPRWSIQNMWDNTMADAVARALQRSEGAAVLHVVGSFHVQYFGGTVAQLEKRRPQAKIATLTVIPVDDLVTAAPRGDLADFVVYAQSYAEGSSGGELSVTVATELDWRLHVPARRDVPLLVWLGDDGEASADALLRWRLALGEDAAVIVVEPPLRQREDDGRIARRWAWPVSFGQDQRPVQLGLARILEYAARRLPIAKDRIVVAGHGAGAASVLWTALYESEPFVPVLAFAPTLPRAIQRAAIPEDRPGARSIAIHDPNPERAAIVQTLDGFTRAGATPIVTKIDPTATSAAEERLVREALGLASRASDDVSGTIALPVDTRTGRNWAELVAATMRAAGTAVEVAVGRSAKEATVLDEAWLRDRFASGAGFPRPEAAFGGATILVLPEPATKAQRDAWSAIVDKGAAERGRFSPLRLATRKDLREHISALASTGTADVLVVPLEFAAPLSRMRALHEAAGDPPDSLTLHWLPGLGAAAAHRAAAGARPDGT